MADEELDYDEEGLEAETVDTRMVVNPRKKRRGGCPAVGCTMAGNEEDVAKHWRHLHNQNIILYCCPAPKCGMKFPVWEEGMWQHLLRDHYFTQAQLSATKELPRVAQIVSNSRFRDPEMLRPYLPEPVLPDGSVSFLGKKTLEDPMRGIMGVPDTSFQCQKPTLTPLLSLPIPRISQNPVVPGPAQTTAPTVPSSASCPPPSPRTDQQPAVDLLEMGASSDPPTPVLIMPNLASGATEEELKEQLWKIDAVAAQLQQVRSATVRRLDVACESQVAALKVELEAERKRSSTLEKELLRLRDTTRRRAPAAVVVGDLERVNSTSAFVLFPMMGSSAIYRLKGQDITLLDLKDRVPCLSSEPL